MLWGKCLLQLQAFGSYRYLLGILEHITSVPELSRLQSLASIWNSVLLNSLVQISADDKKHGVYDQILTLIHKCPFLPELDTASFIQFFAGLVNPSFEESSVIDALRGLCVIPMDSDVEACVKDIVMKLSIPSLLSILDLIFPDKRQEEWIFDICISRHLISTEIFKRVVKEELYLEFGKTRHALKFGLFAIEEDCIDGLLQTLLDGKNENAALELVYRYYLVHDEDLTDELSKQDLLKMYCEKLQTI